MSAITLAEARAAVYNTLNGVAALAGQARVHDYFRWNKDDAALRTLCVGAGGRMNVWMVSFYGADPYTALNAQGAPGHSGINFQQARWAFTLHGYYAHNDAAASEKAWPDQVEAVISAFRIASLTGSPRLGDARILDAGPAQWVENNPVMFAGVLCHNGRLVLPLRVQTYP